MATSSPYTKVVQLGQLADELQAVLGQRPFLRADHDGTAWTLTDTGSVASTAQLDAAIAAHVPDPDYDVPPEEIRLRNVVATLRTWSTQAQAVSAQGGNVTQAQLKTMFGRFSVLLDRFADMLVAGRLGS